MGRGVSFSFLCPLFCLVFEEVVAGLVVLSDGPFLFILVVFFDATVLEMGGVTSLAAIIIGSGRGCWKVDSGRVVVLCLRFSLV